MLDVSKTGGCDLDPTPNEACGLLNICREKESFLAPEEQGRTKVSVCLHAILKSDLQQHVTDTGDSVTDNTYET